jgi:hypothetical protein
MKEERNNSHPNPRRRLVGEENESEKWGGWTRREEGKMGRRRREGVATTHISLLQ